MSHFYGLQGFVALWFFIPLVFLLFTTSIIEISNNKITHAIKALAILDFLIRCLLLIVTYLAVSSLISLSFALQISVGLFSLLLNLLIGWRMHQYFRFYIDNDELTKEEINYVIKDYTNEQKILLNKSSDEQQEIKRAHKMNVYSGYSTLITLLIILGGIIGFSVWGIKYRVIIIICAYILLMTYFYLTGKKLSLLYANEKQQRKVAFKDNFSYLIGILIIYVLQGIIHIETRTLNIMGIFIGCLFLIPTLKTNKKVSENFHKVNKKYIDYSDQYRR